MHSILERAASYLDRMPPSIAGTGGSTALFNATVFLIRGFTMSKADEHHRRERFYGNGQGIFTFIMEGRP